MGAKFYSLIAGIALCAIAFYIGFTFQFSEFLKHFGLCENSVVNILFPCIDYPDIKLMILSIAAGIVLLLGIVFLFHKRAAAIILAVLYSAYLFFVIVLNVPSGYVVRGAYNLIPLKTILTYLSGYPTWTVALNNLAGNFVPFVLLGLILPLTTKQPLKGYGIIALSLTIGAVIEVTQAALQLGVFDIDDILLNALGVAVGYLVTTGIIHRLKKRNGDP